MVHMPSLEIWEWGLKIFCGMPTLTTHVIVYVCVCVCVFVRMYVFSFVTSANAFSFICCYVQSGQFNEDMIPTVGFNMRKVTKGNVTIKVN